jgi:hypothetical protein
MLSSYQQWQIEIHGNILPVYTAFVSETEQEADERKVKQEAELQLIEQEAQVGLTQGYW